MTTVKKCKCNSGYQDEVYGYKNRLFNIGVNQSKCTVCGNVIKGEVKKEKEK
jgi:hypothetical protein